MTRSNNAGCQSGPLYYAYKPCTKVWRWLPLWNKSYWLIPVYPPQTCLQGNNNPKFYQQHFGISIAFFYVLCFQIIGGFYIYYLWQTGKYLMLSQFQKHYFFWRIHSSWEWLTVFGNISYCKLVTKKSYVHNWNFNHRIN